MTYSDNYQNCFWTDFSTLENFMKEAFIKLGTPADQAGIIAQVLISADKKGIDSHGIGRFKPIYIDRIDQKILNPVTEMSIIKETETTAVIDGNNGMGHVIAKKAMGLAIEKAEKYGLGMTAVRNSTHYGIAGYYTDMCAEKNMIGITGTNARPSIAPTFGVENMLGTNPLTIGFPTDEEFYFNIDCATSVTQRGKIEAYERAGKKLPNGWAISEKGIDLSDPKEVLYALTKGTAALTPLGGIGEETGGYKGYSYATAVEILSAALSNAKFMKDLNGSDSAGNKTPILLGHFFIAINIKNFINPSIFKNIAGTILRQLRESKKADGAERIYTAGEKEWIAWQYRKEHGCPVPASLADQLSQLNKRFDLHYKFSWEN